MFAIQQAIANIDITPMSNKHFCNPVKANSDNTCSYEEVIVLANKACWNLEDSECTKARGLINDFKVSRDPKLVRSMRCILAA
jgi:hypothetical protein